MDSNDFSTEDLKNQTCINGEITVQNQGHFAIIVMKMNENRLNINFIQKFNKVLDEIER